jgi:hypothetical protein
MWFLAFAIAGLLTSYFQRTPNLVGRKNQQGLINLSSMDSGLKTAFQSSPLLFILKKHDSTSAHSFY